MNEKVFYSINEMQFGIHLSFHSYMHLSLLSNYLLFYSHHTHSIPYPQKSTIGLSQWILLFYINPFTFSFLTIPPLLSFSFVLLFSNLYHFYSCQLSGFYFYFLFFTHSHQLIQFHPIRIISEFLLFLQNHSHQFPLSPFLTNVETGSIHVSGVRRWMGKSKGIASNSREIPRIALTIDFSILHLPYTSFDRI